VVILTSVVLYGDRDIIFCNFLCKALSNFGKVSFIGESRILIDDNCDFLIIEKTGDISLLGESKFVIFNKHLSKTLKICTKTTAIVSSSNEAALNYLSQSSQKTISCSMSTKDTISLSSITDESAVISLQRQLSDINGRIIEPHDMRVKLSEPADEYYICAAYALLLISGYEPDLTEYVDFSVC